ncbi:MAG: hypothetical protein ACYSU0_10060, partial [Planctomycetota bacterium]
QIVVSAGKDEVKSALDGLRDAKKVSFEDQTNGRVRFRVEADHGKDILGQINKLMREKELELWELHDVPYTLEETFLALTEAEKARI